jgi:hypothetical protein
MPARKVTNLVVGSAVNMVLLANLASLPDIPGQGLTVMRWLNDCRSQRDADFLMKIGANSATLSAT